MALTVNTDTYGTLAEANAYFASRPHSSEWTDVSKTDDQRENALRFAAKHIDLRYEWIGVLKDDSQAMKWPRRDFYDDEGRYFDGSSVPAAVKEAQYEMALQWLWADQLTPPPTSVTREESNQAQVKKEKLGQLEREYFQQSGYMFDLIEGRLREKVYPLVDLMLRPFYLYKRQGSLTAEIFK